MPNFILCSHNRSRSMASTTGPTNGYGPASPGALTATTLTTTGLISATGGLTVVNGLISDTAVIPNGLTCRIPVGGVQTAPLPGTINCDSLQVGAGATAITLSGGKITAGTSTTSSGSYSTVTGGVSNQATGTASTVGGGQSNQATANHATVCGGNGSTATGVGSLSGGTFC